MVLCMCLWRSRLPSLAVAQIVLSHIYGDRVGGCCCFLFAPDVIERQHFARARPVLTRIWANYYQHRNVTCGGNVNIFSRIRPFGIGSEVSASPHIPFSRENLL